MVVPLRAAVAVVVTVPGTPLERDYGPCRPHWSRCTSKDCA